MLRNTQFLYNNLVHIIIGVSLFFTLYNYHLSIRHFIKEEVPKNDVLLAGERGEEIIIIHKTLSK
jgi:hypothetical protein